MSSNRDKYQDIKITNNYISSKSEIKFNEPSWLDHKGKGAILDYELLKGASKNQLVLKSGRKLSAVDAHIYHLRNIHGLKISNNNGVYTIETQIFDKNIIRMTNQSKPQISDQNIIKIGRLVQNHIKNIFQYCETKDPDELYRLMDPIYSKQTFNINYPFCKKTSLISDKETVRFYKPTYVVNDKNLRVCSQWVIESKGSVLKYLISKNIISEEEYLYFKKVVQYIPQKKKVTVSKNSLEEQTISDYQNNSLPKENDQTKDSYSHFDVELRKEAKEMSKHYEILYSLEKTMRNIVLEVMANKYGFDWWDKKVNLEIKKKVDYNRQIERNTGHTQLSENEIDYTTFGDLRQIVDLNWNDFSLKFKNKYAFNRIMYTLNQLRGPIAHSNYLSEDEVTRLNLTVKDWFRLIDK